MQVNIKKLPIDLTPPTTTRCVLSQECEGCMTVNPKVYEYIRQEIISLVIEQSPEKDIIGMCIITTSELVKRYPEYQVKSGALSIILSIVGIIIGVNCQMVTSLIQQSSNFVHLFNIQTGRFGTIHLNILNSLK